MFQNQLIVFLTILPVFSRHVLLVQPEPQIQTVPGFTSIHIVQHFDDWDLFNYTSSQL